MRLFLLLFKAKIAKRYEEVKGRHFEKNIFRKKSASRMSVDPDDFAQVLMHSVEIDNVCALLRHLAGAVFRSTNLVIEKRQRYSKMEEACFIVVNPSSKCSAAHNSTHPSRILTSKSSCHDGKAMHQGLKSHHTTFAICRGHSDQYMAQELKRYCLAFILKNFDQVDRTLL